MKINFLSLISSISIWIISILTTTASDLLKLDSQTKSSSQISLSQENLPIEIHKEICRFLNFDEAIKTYNLLNKYFHDNLTDVIEKKTISKLNICDKDNDFEKISFFNRLLNPKNKPTFKVKSLSINFEHLTFLEEHIFLSWFGADSTLTSLKILIRNNNFWQNDSFLRKYKDRFITKFAQMLATNATLRQLDLSDNLLNYEGASIVEAMEFNKGIEILLMNNTMDEEGMYSERIEEVLAANKVISLILKNPRFKHDEVYIRKKL